MNRSPRLDDFGDVLTPVEAASVLRIGRNLVYELMATKQLYSVRIGRKLLIPKVAIERLLREGNERPPLRLDRGGR